MSGTMMGGSMIGIRGWELVCLGLWLIGVVLVVRYGRARFLVGIYAGATLSALLWDWILGAEWFFRITFDSRFFVLYTIQGRPEPLWAPLSYGFFFGITSLVAIRYRRQLDATLGNWQFVVVPLLLGLSDFVIEGITVGVLDLYVFRYDPAWLLFGVPYTNVLMIAVTECCILYAARGMGELLERAGMPAVSVGAPVVPSAGGGPVAATVSVSPAVVDTPGGLARSWTPFMIGLLIPSGAVYLGVLATELVLNSVQPW